MGTYAVNKIFGGYLLGVASTDDIYFYNWSDGTCIRRIEVSPTNIYWSSEGTSVAVVCSDNYYVLQYNEEIVDKYIANNVDIEEQGIETAFDLEQVMNEVVTSGCYSGEIFIYTNSNQRLNYYIGKQVITLTHLDGAFYVLGYIQKANRVYLIDKRYNIVSYELLRYVLAYQAAIVRDDFDTARKLIEKKKIEPKYFNKLAHFLQGQGHKELALKVSIDPEHQFELALSLKKLSLAKQILLKSPSQQKWKQLADLALVQCDFETVEEAALKANDLPLLYLLYTSTNNKDGLQKLYKLSIANSKFNVAFNILFYLGDISKCIDLLIETDKIPQAAMLSRAYCPSKVEEITKMWKEKLQLISPSAANALGDPQTHPDAFPKGDDYEYVNEQIEENVVVENAVQIEEEKQQQQVEEKVDEIEQVTDSATTPQEPQTQDDDDGDEDKDDQQDSIDAELSDDVSLPSGLD